MPATKKLTLADFLALPETKPASEWIDGRIVQKPMPQGKHSQLQSALVTTLNLAIKPGQLGCAFPELRCVFGDRAIVPDVVVLTWERIPIDEDGEIANLIPLAPDWAIEILSPEQSHTRVTKNLLHCLKHGTTMGWLIDPAEKTVFVYRPKQEIEVFEELEAVLPMPEWVEGVTVTVERLFRWLKF
ncbi:Uma2 family endonuclease [Geitlerinema sp. P-1104]|uniref:Uma2 family endonuclease n=1 Tax=Geitlerinema sp. P-1104 TaxID=2546230 RepID=UPI001476862B|nr:Uma2 family endonuclease [Geitlerinema sp. P-1104]NMG59059.1 Uma2 family endonuclease [Geitlerinema sp. P-1104]